MGSCTAKPQREEKQKKPLPVKTQSAPLDTSVQIPQKPNTSQNSVRQRQGSNASKQSKKCPIEAPMGNSMRLQSPSVNSPRPMQSLSSLPPTPASKQPMIQKQTKIMTNMNQSLNKSKFQSQKPCSGAASDDEQVGGGLKFKQHMSKEYTMMDLISHGDASVVYKLQHNKSQIIRAVKCIKKHHGTKSQAQMQEVFNEIQILQKLDHPNIVQIIDIYEDPKYYYIIEEFCNQGDLMQKITTIKHFDEAQVAHIMNQIFNALAFIHAKNLTHQAIKPQNILFADNLLKITDFGMSQRINKSADSKIDPQQLSSSSIPFMAPELLKEEEGKHVNQKCDIWACGVIMFLILSGRLPFSGQDKNSILKSVLRGAFNLKSNDWDAVSEDAKDLITQCLQFQQKNRPTAAKCADHPWFKKNKGKTKEILKDSLNALKNLKTYKAIQQAAMLYMVRNMATTEEKERLQIAFQELDKDHDGQLSRQEILDGYRKIMGQQAALLEVEKIFEILDKNHSNAIDYSEFVVATSNKTSLLTKANLIKTFKTLDQVHIIVYEQDKSGQLSRKELKAFLINSNFEDLDLDMMIDEIDKNMDGFISQKEFIEMMTKNPEEQP